MQLDYPLNGMGKEEARERIRALGDYLSNRHGILVRWEGENKATFKGRYITARIEGELTLTETTACFRGRDPGFLWRSMARDYVHKKMRMYLDRGTPLSVLPRR